MIFFSSAAAQQILGCCRRSLRYWRAAGRIGYSTVGGEIRYSVDDLLRYAEATEDAKYLAAVRRRLDRLMPAPAAA
jgi:hypothetical protein